ncbi:hypothetical protein [Pseudomonas sp. D(2018)]|uniref:hypothetical protein n=1 Tax=Pseudomonas sp. D(2018) TaxID=2502238 RepID=UPI0010F893E2|nr:hypothetical protein [Pseudomonas sp. D(2018)]
MLTEDYVRWLQEQLAGGAWVSIEQADDDGRANELLSRAENGYAGLAYRLWRSDWEPEAVA